MNTNQGFSGNKGISNQPWPTKELQVEIENLKLTIDVIANFDDVLDDYARTAPNDTHAIPYFADIWPSALALAKYLAQHPNCIQQRSIIELGCGLGLPSIVAAKLGAAAVTATDYHPACIPYCKANTIKNGVGQIQCQILDWRTPTIGTTFDCIIGSDLLYEEQQIASLLHCITKLKKTETQLILADPLRKHIQAATEKLQQSGWKVDDHPIDEILIITARYAG